MAAAPDIEVIHDRSRMLRIYHYLRDFPACEDGLNGGMEKAVAGLAGGTVAAAGTSAETVVLCEGSVGHELVRPEGFRVRCFDNRATAQKRFGLAPDLGRFLGEHDFDNSLFVLHAMFHTGVNRVARILRARGVPYVAAPHDPYHPALFADGRLKKSLYWVLLERPMLRGAAAVQVLDRRHESFLRDRGVRTPVIEVLNGYRTDEVPNEQTLSWRADGQIRILFLGRIDRINKGVDLLVDAFARIASSRPDVRLTIQGPDHGDAQIIREQINRLGLSQRVTLVGPDFAARPTELAAGHDLFVLPSRFEGFGLSALEAMLAARPVVISDIAGLAPHVRRCEGGVVVDATVDSVRGGIEQLIACRRDWREIGLRGRNYILKNLDWTRIAEEALRHYRQLVPSASGRSGSLIAA